MNKIAALLLYCLPVALITGIHAHAQSFKPYLNTGLSTEERVQDLVSKLTLEQKIKLLQYRGTAVNSNGLEIPAYNWWNECLHGVARAGRATVFPQAIGFAATWDTALIKSIADAISDEARAKYAHFSSQDKRGIYQGLNFWTPNINIFRDPRWGRGMETYGEDPYLTGKIASSFIRGLQGDNPNYFKTIATVKHFAVHSGPEQSRHRFNANISDRDFYETYTPAFKMAVQEANVYSLMCAYNRFRDKPCCGSDFLLTGLLRNQWGFKGFIVTDCGAVDDFYRKNAHEVVSTPEEAAAMAIKAGVDLECGVVFDALDKAVNKQLVTVQDLDVAIKRLFTARFRLGFFDPPSSVPYSDIPYTVVENEAHKKLALEAARKSIVLLKNNRLLPLKKSIKTIAVIGPNADDAEVMLANYNGYPSHVVTPLEGIRKKLPGTTVLYAKGSILVNGLPSVELVPAACLFTTAAGKRPGLQGNYFANNDFQGQPAFSRTDSTINFDWIDTHPHPGMDETNFSVTWSGYLKAPVSGKAVLDMYGSSRFELLLEGQPLLKFSSEHHGEHKYAPVDFSKGRMYKIDIRYSSSGPSPQIQLNWQLPGGEDPGKEALRIAARADAVIMCMGLSPRIEGEEMKVKLEGFSGGDRTALALPAVQQKLIRAITALGKPVVLVLINGSALAINWEKAHVPAILETWYGGQEAGTAIADVLFGDYNPGGKLPVTFYASEKQLPDFDNYDMKGRTYRYFEGTPLYPFGYGLSYTDFTYSNLKAESAYAVNSPVTLSADVQNTGSSDGEAVVQLYLAIKGAPVPVPLRTLKGFQRVALKKGEKKTVTFTIKPGDFSIINAEGKAVIGPGKYALSIGGGQPLETSKNTGNNNILTTTIQLTGDSVQLNSF